MEEKETLRLFTNSKLVYKTPPDSYPKRKWKLSFAGTRDHFEEGQYVLMARQIDGGFYTTMKSLPDSPKIRELNDSTMFNRPPTPGEQEWLDKRHFELTNAITYQGGILSRFKEEIEESGNSDKYLEYRSEENYDTVNQIEFNIDRFGYKVAKVTVKSNNTITINFESIDQPVKVGEYDAIVYYIDELFKFLQK